MILRRALSNFRTVGGASHPANIIEKAIYVIGSTIDVGRCYTAEIVSALGVLSDIITTCFLGKKLMTISMDGWSTNLKKQSALKS